MTRRPAGWLRPLAGEKSEKVSKQVSKQNITGGLSRPLSRACWSNGNSNGNDVLDWSHARPLGMLSLHHGVLKSFP